MIPNCISSQPIAALLDSMEGKSQHQQQVATVMVATAHIAAEYRSFSDIHQMVPRQDIGLEERPKMTCFVLVGR